MPNSYHPSVYTLYSRFKPFTTKYTPTLTDGTYAFDLYADPGVIPLIEIALFQIYKGTYYVEGDHYTDKFTKPGNTMVAYIEDGKPMVATCILWTDIDNLVLEIGQGYSLKPKKPFKFSDLADFFLKLYRSIPDITLLFISTCRKSATDAISEMFGMKMTGLFTSPSLRVDYERYLEHNNLNPSGFKGPWYNILYEMLNYHFELYKSRGERSMSVPNFLRSSPLLEKFWQYYPYESFPIPYKILPIPPLVIDYGFDESNHSIITTFWPISHPDLPKKLKELQREKETEPQIKKARETIFGTIGPYFFYEPENIFIPGIAIAKGTIFPYYYNVEDELDEVLTPKWRELSSNIQEMLKVAFYGFNVTSETRRFYRAHEEIYNGLMLNPQLFRGLTLDERTKITTIIAKYPSKYTEKDVINKLDAIIQKK
jgi:hypothetical protein